MERKEQKMGINQNEEQSPQMAFVDAAGELIAYLKENRRPDEAASVFVMAAYTKQIEEKLVEAMQQIAEMQSRLEVMQEEQKTGNDMLLQYLSESSENLAVQYRGMKSELTDIKAEMTEKAVSIVGAVKQKGKGELARVSEYLQLQDKLENFCGRVRKALGSLDEIIRRIDAVGSHMRSAGVEIKNAARAVVGREEKSGMDKKFSLTDLLKKPFLAQRKLLGQILKGAEKAGEKCKQLSAEAGQKRLDAEPVAFEKRAKVR